MAPRPKTGDRLRVGWLETLIGTGAAFCTTASYIPQLHKAWKTGQTGDLSLRMLMLLATGLGLWLVYGLIRSDLVITIANSISVMLLGCILYFKLNGQSPEQSGDDPGGGY